MSVGANLGFVGTDVVVRHALALQLRDQPSDRALFLARNQIGGKLERRFVQQLVEELPAHRLALFGPDATFQSRSARPRADASSLSTLIESRNA